MTTTPILLIDLGSVWGPVWHSVPASEPAGTAHDVAVSRVRRLVANHRGPAAVCADATGGYFRHEIYPAYKSNRESKSEAAVAQLARVIETCRLDGVPVWCVPSFEADDLIATATTAARKQGLPVIINTSDKDLLCLVGPGVIVRSMTTGVEMGPAEVVAKFGVTPTQLGDWLALVGDTADNVPGVPSVGPKTATALLTAWGSLAGLMAAAEDPEEKRLDDKMRAKLLAAAPQLLLSRQLVSLRDDVPIQFDEVRAERVRKPLPCATPSDAFDDHEEKDEEPVSQEIQTREPEYDESEPQQPAQEPQEHAPPPRQERPQQSRAVTLADAPSRIQIAPPAGPDQWAMALEPTDSRQAFLMAKALHDARLFPNLDSPERIFAAMMLGRAHGIMAIPMCQQVHVISGKLTLHATVIEGLVLKSRYCKYFQCVDSSPTSATYETQRVGSPKVARLTYTIEEAVAAGLTGNAQYKKRPAVMLRHRAGTDLARMVYPDVVGGLYTPDELGVDIDENGRVAA